MTFYGQTKVFFGGDKAISDMINAQLPALEYLELETLSLKIIVNMYSCFFKDFPTKNNVNINMHIQEVCRLLKISPIEAMKRFVNSELIVGSGLIESRLNNYFPYLKGVLSNCLSKIFMLQSGLKINFNVIKKHEITAKRIETSFALASCLFTKPCALHLFSAFGYLDKLL